MENGILMTDYESRIIELEDVRIEGKFIGSETIKDEDYWLFSEDPSYINPVVLRVKKKMVKGNPKMNHYGYLVVNDSYLIEPINDKWFISKGTGRLITFEPCPF